MLDGGGMFSEPGADKCYGDYNKLTSDIFFTTCSVGCPKKTLLSRIVCAA